MASGPGHGRSAAAGSRKARWPTIAASFFTGSPMFARFPLYLRLVRMDKPIGSLLLLWPTLNALWIATDGHPPLSLLAIFVIGTVLMRSAGCAINDYADRDFDLHVKRTANRPLTSGKIKAWEAVALAAGLSLVAFLLIQPLNTLTKELSVVALFVAGSYPFMKRFFAIPQAYLGIAFGFGIPMAFAATQNHVPMLAWIMLAANVFWAVAYDTEYAMVDRDDDIKIGIRTSALTFGRFDVLAVVLCYAVTFAIYVGIGVSLGFGIAYWIGFAAAVGCAVYHYTLIRGRERMACFAAFRHNNWLGGALFAGIAAHYVLAGLLSGR
jgi:4-hydroxybenzoate polyprenyltransferase